MSQNSTMEPLISVANISRTFEQSKKEPGVKGTLQYLFHRQTSLVHAVNDISFEINEGEFVGFIGANGAGKTTTLKMLSGILHPTSGNIRIAGYAPADRHKDFLRMISLVMGQKSQLQWDLPVYDSLLFNKEVYGMSKKDFTESLDELITYLQLEPLLKVQARKLSLGQRMKCELAASLIYRPKILFLDEPTIGLDVAIQQNIREFLKKYNEEKKTTIILTSHYMDDIESLCKRVIIIAKGSLIYNGDIQTLMNQYVKSKYIKIIFSDMPSDISVPGMIVFKDDTSMTIAVPKEDHLSAITEIMAKYSVKDITISEPSLEEIIRTIFNDSLATNATVSS